LFILIPYYTSAFRNQDSSAIGLFRSLLPDSAEQSAAERQVGVVNVWFSRKRLKTHLFNLSSPNPLWRPRM